MLEIFKFECRYQLRSPLFLVLSVVFFLFAFFLMASDNIQLGGVSGSLNYNAAWTIVFTQFFFSMIGMMAAIAIVSQAITRDYELKTAEILFATGVSEKGFLLGRFLSASLFGVLVGLAALLGTLIGTLMPWLDPEKVGAFSIAPYLYAACVVTIPNLLFTSALFFALAALTRSMLAAFTGAVGFLVLYVIVGALADPEQIELLAMLDPFGSTAFAEVSRYWTVFERNAQLVPIEGNLLANRLLWAAIGLSALGVTLWRYHFSLNPSPFRWRRNKAVKREALPALHPVSVHQRFDAATPWRQFRSQVRMDLAGIYKSVPFYAIMGFAALNVIGGFSAATNMYGTPLLPVTSAMLRAVGSTYTFFILLIVIYYAGELVQRERQAEIADVVDSTPFPNFVMVASKVVALWFIIFCLLMFGMLAAMVQQLIEGYTHFEIGLYLQGLLLMQGALFFLFAVIAVFVQTVAGNKWLGMVAVLAFFIFMQSLSGWGLQHDLYVFGTPPAPHSDMNGFGHFFTPFVTVVAYWGACCGLLLVGAHLLFRRGRSGGPADILTQARVRLTRGVALSGVAALLLFAALGGWIYYNVDVLNNYMSTDDVDELQAAYEKANKHHETAVTPEVIAVDSQVHLYPADRRLESAGEMQLVNKADNAIEEVLVNHHLLARLNSLELQGAELIDSDERFGSRLYRFAPPLAPGAETTLRWDLTWDHEGFANSNVGAVTGNASNRVVANGTFVNNTEIMPFFGYNSSLEIGDPNTRREYGLPPIRRLPTMGDPQWLGVSQFGVSERTAFRTVFSTSADQIAVAPGYLVGTVEERNGRRFYTYEMDEPIWPFFAFVSARYEVARDEHNGVAIEVYHDAKHPFNIEPMIRGTKKSLDYFNAEFSPYQYRQFRILEFPRYATFAQSFPNTIPYSEAIGFVADLRDEHALDLVFYVTAHELAHQWWGHQVAGARMQGMTVIVETLAQYSALMVMEQEYGHDKMRRFLRYELDRYLSARGGEMIEELPLAYSENQAYIHYQKGSLAMYALKDAMGEDRVNLALRNFLDKFAYGNGPFPTALDLVAEFRAVASAEHQALITDLFEKITVYDFAVDAATVEQVGDEWEVRFSATAAKYYADGEGQETPADLHAWVDVAVFPPDPDDLQDYQLPAPLFFERRLLRSTSDDDGNVAEVVVRVKQRPHRVGIDPYNKMIDRNPEDNLKTLGAG